MLKKGLKERIDRVFTPEEKQRIAELRNDSKSYSEIAFMLCSTKSKVKGYCVNNGLGGFRADKPKTLREREAEYIKRFNKKFPVFEYLSGYEACDSTINVRCKKCGHVQQRHANSKSGMLCDNCVKIARIKRAEAKENDKAKRSRKENEYTETVCAECGKEFLRKGNNHKYCSEECFNKANNIRQIKTKVCEECGNEFKTYHGGNTCCSDKCRKKRANRLFRTSKDERLKKNGKPDYSITLDKLIKRDSNTCYICGEKCDSNDFIITDDGYFVVGDKYPSIDHVFPIAKGGRHQWDNVKLAHMICNVLKSDKIIIENELKQLRAV